MKSESHNLSQLFKEDRQLAVLIDPEDFKENPAAFLKKIPSETNLILVGGSSVEAGRTEKLISALKAVTNLPLVLFPGDYTQLSHKADGLLLLSLLSGRNPEYLVNQHIKAIDFLEKTSLEIIPTAYILVDGG